MELYARRATPGTISILTNRMVELDGWHASPGKIVAHIVWCSRQRAVELADQTLSGISFVQLRQMRTTLELIESRLRGYIPLEKPVEQPLQ